MLIDLDDECLEVRGGLLGNRFAHVLIIIGFPVNFLAAWVLARNDRAIKGCASLWWARPSPNSEETDLEQAA
jgi:hypothetical protein